MGWIYKGSTLYSFEVGRYYFIEGIGVRYCIKTIDDRYTLINEFGVQQSASFHSLEKLYQEYARAGRDFIKEIKISEINENGNLIFK